MNAEIKLYEKGLQISTRISGDSLFVEWHRVISCTINRQTLIKLITYEGVIRLKKIKKETDISQFTKILKSTVPEIEIEYVKSEPDNLRSIEMKRAEKLYDEHERRVNEFIKSCGGKDDSQGLGVSQVFSYIVSESICFEGFPLYFYIYKNNRLG